MIDSLLSECLLVSNNTFKLQVEKLKEFVTDEQWREILIFDMSLNPKLAAKIIKYIDIINFNKISTINIERIIKKIRKDTLKLIEEASLVEDTVSKWLKYREVYAHYGFLETIIEGSKITDYIFNGIKNKYGSKYLSVLEVVDNLNPSELTNLTKKSNGLTIDYDDLLDLYLLMKKWQDNQHVFNEQVILDNYRACKEEFISKVINDCPYFKDINGIYLTVLYLLDRCSIIPIRLLTRFVFNDTVKYLANVIGGKGVGLAILLANGFRIPPTYIIPVGSLLGNRYLQYLELLKINTFAVRSSATVEDNINHSFAGMFVSCLDVNRSELTTSIDMVKESLYSERVKKYISHFKTRKPYMAVILQRYRKPQFSGVWMGQEEDSGSLEWIYGKGEELVSGKVTPKREVWSAKTNNKDYLKINDEFIGKNCLLIQEKLNFIADIEWCAVNNRIIWLQLRPVTRILMSNKSFERKVDNIYGISTSSGIAVGKPVFLKSIEEKDKIKSGDILLADYTDPDWLPIMIKCSGVVTAEGGALSHTAIISRELGIPCIVGIGYENIDYLKTANLIEIDGSTGSVEIQ